MIQKTLQKIAKFCIFLLILFIHLPFLLRLLLLVFNIFTPSGLNDSWSNELVLLSYKLSWNKYKINFIQNMLNKLFAQHDNMINILIYSPKNSSLFRSRITFYNIVHCSHSITNFSYKTHLTAMEYTCSSIFDSHTFFWKPCYK